MAAAKKKIKKKLIKKTALAKKPAKKVISTKKPAKGTVKKAPFKKAEVKKAAPRSKDQAAKPISEEAEKTLASHAPEIERLVAKGREQGFVTQQEIMAAIPEIEEDVDMLDDLYQTFFEYGV